jgi:hypothetical protein
VTRREKWKTCETVKDVDKHKQIGKITGKCDNYKKYSNKGGKTCSLKDLCPQPEYPGLLRLLQLLHLAALARMALL